MNKLLITALFLGTCFCSASGAEEAKRVILLRDILQRHTIEGFMEAVRANRWAAPRIPSKWFVDTKVSDEEERRQMQEARDFGYQLMLRLDNLAQGQWELRSRDALFRRTLLLCDLGDWCAETIGYGNILLAQRCLDLVADGLKRLTASPEFPLGDCKRIAARMNPGWLGVPYQIQMLNGEANANIFINPGITREQLERQWGIGFGMRMIRENPKLAVTFGQPPPPDAELVDVGAFTNNLGFFMESENFPDPATPAGFWDWRRHRWVAGGNLGGRAHSEALSLLKYRSVVGFFPKELTYSEDDKKRMDAAAEEAARLGQKTIRMDDPYWFDPLAEGFRVEWQKHVQIRARDFNEYRSAAKVYKAVSIHSFFDE